MILYLFLKLLAGSVKFAGNRTIKRQAAAPYQHHQQHQHHR
jgi:hypothetical protein